MHAPVDSAELAPRRHVGRHVPGGRHRQEHERSRHGPEPTKRPPQPLHRPPDQKVEPHRQERHHKGRRLHQRPESHQRPETVIPPRTAPLPLPLRRFRPFEMAADEARQRPRHAKREQRVQDRRPAPPEHLRRAPKDQRRRQPRPMAHQPPAEKIDHHHKGHQRRRARQADHQRRDLPGRGSHRRHQPVVERRFLIDEPRRRIRRELRHEPRARPALRPRGRPQHVPRTPGRPRLVGRKKRPLAQPPEGDRRAEENEEKDRPGGPPLPGPRGRRGRRLLRPLRSASVHALASRCSSSTSPGPARPYGYERAVPTGQARRRSSGPHRPSRRILPRPAPLPLRRPPGRKKRLA